MIGTFPPDKARQLWDRWARYEYQYGDLATAQKFEKRMTDAYPNGMSRNLESHHNPLSPQIDFIDRR